MSDNPKDKMGVAKVAILSVIPSTALIHFGEAMRYGAHEAPKADGTKGYGPFNWRESPVKASIYTDAAIRHILDWIDGEECAPDSKAKHLGHAMACLGIVLDAQEMGTLVDDRPRKGHASELMESLRRKVEPSDTARAGEEVIIPITQADGEAETPFPFGTPEPMCACSTRGPCFSHR